MDIIITHAYVYQLSCPCTPAQVNLNLAPMLDPIKKLMSIGLASLWFFAVVVGTFYAPFPSTDEANGQLNDDVDFILIFCIFIT